MSVRTSDVSKAPRIHDLIIGILTKLSHTPITAAGLNQLLQMPTKGETDWHKIGDTLAPKNLIWSKLYDERLGLLNISIQFPRKEPFPGHANITVQPSASIPNGVLVTSNIEFTTADQVGSAPQVVEFIQTEWGSGIKEATRVAELIFRRILWEQAT